MLLQRLSIIVLFIAAPSMAQQEDFPILFTNVHVFDGVNEERIENANVLVVGNLIAEVSTEPLVAANAQVIDGGGRTLMPGIIEGHNHLMLPVDTASQLNTHDVYYVGAAAAAEAEGYLMRGWTTVRDTGVLASGTTGPYHTVTSLFSAIALIFASPAEKISVCIK